MTALDDRRDKRSPSKRRARRRQQRGTAFVETAIMLPFLVIVFAGIVYLGHFYLAKQRALLMARSCAWRYAYNACTALPPGCPEGIFQDHKDAQPDPKIMGQIDQAKATTQQRQGGSNTNAFADKTGGIVDDMVGFVLGEAATATNVRTVPLPTVLSTTSSQARASYYLACNTKEKDPLEMAIDLFKTLVPGL